MSSINIKHKTVQVKIVYYGPGRGGKTTNLEYLYKRFIGNVKTELISIKTDGDRTIFFDFLPIDLGKIKGYDIKVQLYTVPGQVMYNATRKLVLKGVDGIVFVADSVSDRKEKNIESLQNLRENLEAQNLSLESIPIVMQYNKRDLENEGAVLLGFETLDKDLNSDLKAPTFMASAIKGDKVIDTMKKILTITMANISDKLT